MENIMHHLIWTDMRDGSHYLMPRMWHALVSDKIE